MLRKISTEKAPAAIGPYSQGIIVNGLLFASGQIPIDPATGEIEGTDIGAQAERVCRNIGGGRALQGRIIQEWQRLPVFWRIWAILQPLMRFMHGTLRRNLPGAAWR